MKKTFITAIACILFTACENPKEHVKENGLSYRFINYIGPDSCKLFKCYPDVESESFVYLTICDNQRTTATEWTEQHGKTSVDYTNNLVYDTIIDTAIYVRNRIK